MIAHNIITYLQQQSKGLVNISLADANHIVNMVVGQQRPQQAFAKLWRIGHNNVPELQRTITTTNEAIHQAIIQSLDAGPTHGFYTYELYNDAQELEGRIYTANPNLLD